jgi:hypothetical protein
MAQAPKSLDVELNVSGIAVIRPGDHLVVACTGVLGVADGNRKREELMAEIPGVEVTLLSGVSAMAVYRPASGAGSAPTRS